MISIAIGFLILAVIFMVLAAFGKPEGVNAYYLALASLICAAVAHWWPQGI